MYLIINVTFFVNLKLHCQLIWAKINFSFLYTIRKKNYENFQIIKKKIGIFIKQKEQEVYLNEN